MDSSRFATSLIATCPPPLFLFRSLAFFLSLPHSPPFPSLKLHKYLCTCPQQRPPQTHKVACSGSLPSLPSSRAAAAASAAAACSASRAAAAAAAAANSSSSVDPLPPPPPPPPPPLAPPLPLPARRWIGRRPVGSGTACSAACTGSANGRIRVRHAALCVVEIDVVLLDRSGAC